MIIRSMTPQVVVADEIGTEEDVKMINYAMCSGCKGIFTAHGANFDELYLNPIVKELINMHIFELIVFLDENVKGEIKDLYILDKKMMQYKKQEKEDKIKYDYLIGENNGVDKAF